MPTYIDVHVLQSLPPSNVNRDDAGSPKEAIYGGVRRARVSSQAWKRATRKAFEGKVPREQLGVRTRLFRQLVLERLRLVAALEGDAADRVANAIVTGLGITAGKNADQLSYLLFFGREQLDGVIRAIADDVTTWSQADAEALTTLAKGLDVRKVLGTGHPLDVALFGRMVADVPNINVDAAAQVAHALSTHAVDIEFDYFTAVDDENKADSGAGMIGTIEFSSATLYRFATVGLEQLRENLGGDLDAALQALELFITAFCTSMPSGHQTSFAAHTMPALVTVVVRPDQPVNLVSAFESPVRTAGEGTVEESIARLAKELDIALTTWGREPVLVASTFAPSHTRSPGALGEPMPFAALVPVVSRTVRERATEGAA